MKLIAAKGPRDVWPGEYSEKLPYNSSADLDEEHASVSESQPQPRRMKYSDISNVVKTTLAAVKEDPLNRYMQDTAGSKPSRVRRAVARACFRLSWSLCIYRNYAWTIDDGDAIIRCSEPYKDSQRSRKGKVVDAIGNRLLRTERLFDSKEQRKRRTEIGTKMMQTAEATLGKMEGQMVSLDSIATHPEKQGRGYGTALGKIVTDIADTEGRDSWLFSSNVEANTGFYNNLGYITVATFKVGDNNPAWKEKPVTVALMVRTYTPPPEKEEEHV